MGNRRNLLDLGHGEALFQFCKVEDKHCLLCEPATTTPSTGGDGEPEKSANHKHFNDTVTQCDCFKYKTINVSRLISARYRSPFTQRSNFFFFLSPPAVRCWRGCAAELRNDHPALSCVDPSLRTHAIDRQKPKHKSCKPR